MLLFGRDSEIRTRAPCIPCKRRLGKKSPFKNRPILIDQPLHDGRTQQTSRTQQPRDRRDEMNGENRQVTHPVMLTIRVGGARLGSSQYLCDKFEFATHRQYGYELQSQTAERKTFSKLVGDSHVDVSIYHTEIAFTVAGGDADAIFEALQDASELCDSEHMALFDPQTGEWQDA